MADDKNLEKDTMFTDEEILNHDYDGIKEMNNGMPFWLTGLFAGCIIWSILYYIHYTSGSGPTQTVDYQETLAAHNAKVAKQKSEAKPVDLLATLNTPEGIEHGASVYKMRCVACHGQKGGGSIGPNLTDNFWLHGDDSVESIIKLVSEGVTSKGMPAWANVMSEKDVIASAYYIKSIIGSNPAGAKAGQGKEIK